MCKEGLYTLELSSRNTGLEHLVKFSWCASLSFREVKVGDKDAAEHPTREDQIGLGPKITSVTYEL